VGHSPTPATQLGGELGSPKNPTQNPNRAGINKITTTRNWWDPFHFRSTYTVLLKNSGTTIVYGIRDPVHGFQQATFPRCLRAVWLCPQRRIAMLVPATGVRNRRQREVGGRRAQPSCDEAGAAYIYKKHISYQASDLSRWSAVYIPVRF
jgi:hypothetical protein